MIISISNRITTSVIVYIVIILIFSGIDLSEAKWGRGGSGRISSSRGSSGRGGSSGRSRPPVYRPAPPPVYRPPVHHPAPPPINRPSSPPVHHPAPPPRYIPSPPPLPPLNHAPNNQHIPKPSAPHPPPLNPKDSSNILIHHEGGGRQKPPLSHDVHQTSPMKPGESINKVNVPTSQNIPPGSSSNNYPPWANPSSKPGSNPSLGSPSAPYPGSHPIGAPPSTYPHPGSPSSAPYPGVHPVGMPQPSHTSPGLSSAPYPNSHPVGMPKPSNPSSPIGFNTPGHSTNPIGQPHQAPSLGSGVGHPSGHVPTSYGPPPAYGAPSGTHGGYGPPPAYNYPGASYHPPAYGQPPNYHPPAYGQPPSYHQSTGMGQPTYMHPPVYGGAGSQPFVPGQSVIVLPGQSKGPGLGQMVKEALVFSTINAGVNRIINGAPHHWHDSYNHNNPIPGTTSTVTNNTTIINNNYGSPDGQPTGTSNSPYPNQFPNIPNSYSPNNPNNYPSGYNNNPNNAYAPNNSPNNAYTPNNSPNAYTPNNSPNAYSPNNNPSPSNVPVSNSGFPSNANNFPSRISENPAPNYNNTYQSSGNVSSGNFSSPPPEEVMPLNYYITESELLNLTEKLFAQNEMNMNQQPYVLNLQKKVSNVSDVKDEAPQPLLYLDNAAYAHPTITALRDIYDNYEFNSTKKENITKTSRMKEGLFIDTILNTDVMTSAIKWLQEKYYIEPDAFEVKDTLRRIWFSKMDGYTSGFERIFMAEWYPGPSLLGGQNWVYFDHEEYQKKLNYLSYVDKVDIKNKISLVKMNIEMAGVIKPNVTMLIGTPPELEMALYTVCYYARPNDICPVSLGGIVLNIYSHSYRYFGKDLMDLGLIMY